MKNKATKDTLRLKPEEEPAKKKSKKVTKPKPSTPQQSTETEKEPVPMASSSAIELTKADDAPKQSKAPSLYELPGEAAEPQGGRRHLTDAMIGLCDVFVTLLYQY